jgi:hypothetical protein
MFTSEQVQSYIRIAIYWAAGFAVNYGYLTADRSTAIAGAVVTAANFGWTLWGNRLVAKLNELAKLGEVKAVVVATPAVAQSVTSTKVVSQ